MKRTVVCSTIVFLAAAASPALAGSADVTKHGATPRPAVPNERVYEIPPGTRTSPIVIGQYCNEDDCSTDRDRRCGDRGHGAANDSAFHISPEGSGNCLITCDDGYMLLVVEDECVIGARRTTFGRHRRQIWFAPADRPCVDAHDVGTDQAVCATVRPATRAIERE